MSQENQYLELLIKLLDAPVKTDRTGTGTHSVFGHQMRFDLSKGFPLLTTKKVHFRSIVIELLWFLKGDTNVQYLKEHKVSIWDEWAKEDGELGKIYGHQWRNFGDHEVTLTATAPTGVEVHVADYYHKGFDQITWLIQEIQKNPNSRRLYVTAANPQDKENQALDCCHNYFQVTVQDGKLNMYFQMRSTDVFLGLPFNIASYALLTHLLARECGLEVGELVYSGVDVHLYSNHVDQAKEQLTRKPYPFPKLDLLYEDKSLFEIEPDDIGLLAYNYHPAIKAPVAV